MSTRLAWLAFPLISILMPVGLLADDSPSGSEPIKTSIAPGAEAATAPLGITVFVDPETGQLTDQPTAEQEAWLRTELERRAKTSSTPDGFQPRPVPLLDGGEGLALQNFVVSSTVVVTQPSGTWATTCRRDGVPHTHAHGMLESSEPSAKPEASTSHDTAPVM